ncbi:hypothetical protein [Deefgea sp. CFH1-16]|uniref:hypothetical protein n=1 Tax=Deefgea sp. CFH1-16 TaxID=2675457 RepID=UPI0015F387E4|nr:hypothetical protein [Deefgea sp. CFH1-16]MBM5574199.1 hypothetical protein [Deefgea sp. CFH1-16]
MWSTIRSWFTAKPKLSADDEATIERLVDIAHPHIRLARNYLTRLAPYMRWAQTHANALAAQLPAPIELNNESWRKDRTLQLLFATPDRMSEVIGRDPGLQAWFAAWPLVDVAYVGLIADAQEKVRFGMSEHAGQIRQDVPQKLLIFSNYQLGQPAQSPDALMQLGAERILDTVAIQAQLAIANVENKKKQLESTLVNARTMLRMQNSNSMTPSPEQIEQQTRIKNLTAELQVIHQQLNPDALCELLITELAATPDILRLEVRHCNVDRMGIIDSESSDNQRITLPELILQREHPIEKLIILMAVPRQLMQAPSEKHGFPEQVIF